MRLVPLLALMLIFSLGFSTAFVSVSRTDLLWKGEGVNNKFDKAWLVEAVVQASSSNPWSSGEQLTFGVQPKDPDSHATSEEIFYVSVSPTKQYCDYQLQPYTNARFGSAFLWKIQFYGPKTFRIGAPWEEKLVGFRDWVVSNGICDDVDYSKWGSGTLDWCVNPKHALIYYSPHAGTIHVDVIMIVADPIYYPSSPVMEPSGSFSRYFGVNVAVRKESESSYTSKTIDVDNPSSWINSNVYAQLVGGLQTKFDCPQLAGTYVFVPKGVGNYVPTSRSEYGRYVSMCTPQGEFGHLTIWTTLSNALQQWEKYGDYSNLDSLVRQCNGLTSQLMAGKRIGELATTYNMYTSPSKARITFDNSFISYPVLRFLINADWLKIMITVPKPQIVNVYKPSSFNNRQIANIYVDVKNDGKFAGDVTVKLSCTPQVYYPLGIAQTVSLDPSETKRVKFQVKYAATASANINCRVVAYSTADPSIKDEKSFSMDYKFISYLCEPGSEWCSDEDPTKIYYCTEDGKIAIKADCSTLGRYVCGYTAEGKPSCVSKEAPPPSEGKFKVPLKIVGLLIVILVSFVIVLYYKQISRGIKIIKKVV